jgi:hypothetical protein
LVECCVYSRLAELFGVQSIQLHTCLHSTMKGSVELMTDRKFLRVCLEMLWYRPRSCAVADALHNARPRSWGCRVAISGQR